jgi:hypothetical protein
MLSGRDERFDVQLARAAVPAVERPRQHPGRTDSYRVLTAGVELTALRNIDRLAALEAIGMRRSMIVGLLILALLALATPARAQDTQGPEAFVVLSGRADVPEGQRVGDLVVFHGSSTVAGTVDGSLTAFDAPVTISGRVNGDVIVFNGRVVLRSGANVTGDVVSQQAPVVAPGATIGGTTRRVQTNVNWEGFGWVGRLAWWLAVSVSTLVVGLALLWLGRVCKVAWDCSRLGRFRAWPEPIPS